MRIIKNSSALPGRYESTKIMLSDGGADWDSHSWDAKHHPLRIAVRRDDLDMCRLLIRIGKMNPLSALKRDGDGHMVLKDVSFGDEKNRLAITQQLRQEGEQSVAGG